MKKILTIFVFATFLLASLSACSAERGLTADGSTSMERVIGALGEGFHAQSDISLSYNPTGSGAGIQGVLDGRCDIGLSSRALKPEEEARGLVGTVLAYDAIALIVHPNNPVSDLDMEQLAAVFTGQITNWSALGGQEGQIVLIGREAGSGTRDGFESVTGTEGQCAYRQELTSTGDVITTVAQNPNAIGYASVASLKDSVKTLRIGGTLPTEQNVRDGSYAVQRPFLLVTSKEQVLSEQAQQFLDYVRSDAAKQIIASAGVVAAE